MLCELAETRWIDDDDDDDDDDGKCDWVLLGLMVVFFVCVGNKSNFFCGFVSGRENKNSPGNLSCNSYLLQYDSAVEIILRLTVIFGPFSHQRAFSSLSGANDYCNTRSLFGPSSVTVKESFLHLVERLFRLSLHILVTVDAYFNYHVHAQLPKSPVIAEKKI